MCVLVFFAFSGFIIVNIAIGEEEVTETEYTVSELYSDEKLVGVIGKGGHYATFYYATIKNDTETLRVQLSENEWNMFVTGDTIVLKITTSYSLNGEPFLREFRYNDKAVSVLTLEE